MKKFKHVLLLLGILLILAACSQNGNKGSGTGIPNTPGVSDNDKTKIIKPNLNTEEGIKNYLVGEWIFDKEYVSDVKVKMAIDEFLNVKLIFISDENKEETFAGKIALDRYYSDEDEVPDLITLNLDNNEEYGGDFFFQHKTIYDQKRVMSWFFAGNENCVFDKLLDGDYGNVPSEVIFEKLTGEFSDLKSAKDKEFYAVYWGKSKDGNSIWLDEVLWEQSYIYDNESMYPNEMIVYENEDKESILYQINIDENEIVTSWGDDLFPGTVYFVKTDEQGVVTEFIDGEQKLLIDGDWVDQEIREAVFNILRYDCQETQAYLDIGMAIEYDGEIEYLDGNECYLVYLGTQHDEYFVRELTYAVNPETAEVYYYDVLTDVWEILGVG